MECHSFIPAFPGNLGCKDNLLLTFSGSDCIGKIMKMRWVSSGNVSPEQKHLQHAQFTVTPKKKTRCVYSFQGQEVRKRQWGSPSVPLPSRTENLHAPPSSGQGNCLARDLFQEVLIWGCWGGSVG